MSNSMPKVETFLSALTEQRFFKDENTQGSVLWYIAFYKTRAPNRRKTFRTTGFILLFLSISLPFITQLSPPECKPQVASWIAWLIALVAAANSFFNWQKSWRLYIQTQLTLQFALSDWELRTVKARAAAPDEEGVKILQAALQRLTKTVTEAVEPMKLRSISKASRFQMCIPRRTANHTRQSVNYFVSTMTVSRSFIQSGSPLPAAPTRRNKV